MSASALPWRISASTPCAHRSCTLFTADCQTVIGSEVEPTRLILEPGGGAEQDPEDWWRAICAASRRLLERHPEQARRIAAVGCTAQWSGTVPVDGDGRAIGNAII